MPAQDFTIDAFVDALTRLPEYGGFEALAGGLGEAYPEATFSAGSDDTYGSGFRYQNLPLSTYGPTTGPFTMYSPEVMRRFGAGGVYNEINEALWPTLTGLVNPPQTTWAGPGLEPGSSAYKAQLDALAIKQAKSDEDFIKLQEAAARRQQASQTAARGIGKTGGHELEKRDAELTDLDTAQWDTGDSVKSTAGTATSGGTGGLGASAYNYDDFYKVGADPVYDYSGTTGTNVATDETVGSAVGAGTRNNIDKALTTVGSGDNTSIKVNLDGSLDLESGVGTGVVPAVGTGVGTGVVDTTTKKEGTDEGTEEGAGIIPSSSTDIVAGDALSPDLTETTASDVVDTGSGDIIESSTDIGYNPEESIISSRIGTGEYEGDKTGYPGADAPLPEGVAGGVAGQQTETGEITKGMSDDKKAEVGDITNQAINYLKSTGWADSGVWSYARTRNMLTGGGQGPVVTQGPLVPWKSLGQDAPSTDYISNVGDRDYFPSRLAPGERLGETAASGALGYVPPNKRTGWDQTIDTGGSLLPVDSTIIVDAYNNLPDDIKLALPSIKENDLKRAQTYLNTLRNSNITKDTFKDAKTVDDIGNTLGGFLSDVAGGVKGLGSKITESIKTLTGMTDEDVAGKNFFEIMDTNIPLFETPGGSGITPLDIIMLASGGLAALPLIAMNKFGQSLFAPFTNAIKGGIKSVFDFVLGKSDKLLNTKGSELSQEDINAYELAGLVNSLGIDKPAGTIDKGIYYDSSGKALSDNMQRLNFNMNDKGSIDEFTNAILSIAESVDPDYKNAYWMPDTGEVLVERLDGTWVRKAGYVPIDSDGNMYKGDPKVTRKNMTSFDPKEWFHLDQTTFAGLDPSYGAESNMIDILREWEKQRKQPGNL